MNWLDSYTSLYKCQADNYGREATFRDILFSDFGIPHEWYYRDPADPTQKQWLNGVSNDLDTILQMRELDPNSAADYVKKVELKKTLQSYTPAALFECKKKGQTVEKCRTGLMQLDFDHADIQDFDLDELKAFIFSFPYTAYCGLSGSGKGFYSLMAIAEPDKLNQYAEHCFAALLEAGIKADTSKGRNPENLRYLSYDANMLIRENPEPLRIKHFKTFPTPKKETAQTYSASSYTGCDGLIRAMLKLLQDATRGNRWQTVQKVSATLGGLGNTDLIGSIKNAIENNREFDGENAKYFQCAEDCFSYGLNHPLPKLNHAA